MTQVNAHTQPLCVCTLIVTMTEVEGSYGPKVVAASNALFVDCDGDIVFDETVEGTYALVPISEGDER